MTITLNSETPSPSLPLPNRVWEHSDPSMCDISAQWPVDNKAENVTHHAPETNQQSRFPALSKALPPQGGISALIPTRASRVEQSVVGIRWSTISLVYWASWHTPLDEPMKGERKKQTAAESKGVL